MNVIGFRSRAGSVSLSTKYTKTHIHWLRAPWIINCAASFSGCLYLNAFRPRLDTIIRVNSANDQIRVAVEIAVGREGS